MSEKPTWLRCRCDQWGRCLVDCPTADTPVPKCPGCELNAYEFDKGTTMRHGRRWHWSCVRSTVPAAADPAGAMPRVAPIVAPPAGRPDTGGRW